MKYHLGSTALEFWFQIICLDGCKLRESPHAAWNSDKKLTRDKTELYHQLQILVTRVYPRSFHADHDDCWDTNWQRHQDPRGCRLHDCSFGSDLGFANGIARVRVA